MTENPVSPEPTAAPAADAELKVDALSQGEAQPAPTAQPAPAPKSSRRQTPLIIAAVVLVVLLFAAGGGFAYLRASETRLLDQAQAALSKGDWAVVESSCNELKALPASLLVDPNRCLPLRGEAYVRQAKLDEALTILQSAQALYPKQTNLYLLTTEVYLQQNKFDEALTTLQAAQALSPDQASLYLMSAEVYLKQNKPDLALTAAGEAQKRDDSLALPYTLQAVDAYQHSRIKDAEQAAQAALKRDPKQAAALRVLGSIQLWRGDFKSASETLKQALELNPKDFDALADRAVLNVFTLHREEFRTDSAAVIAQNASTPAALMLQAMKASDEHDPAAAYEWINQAVQADDSRPEYYYMRASLYPTTEKESKSQLADLDKALQLYPDFGMAQALRAQILFALYEPVDLAAEAERLLKAAPEFVDGYEMMVMHFLRQSDWTHMLEWANRYVDAMPNHSGAYALRGFTKYAMGDKELALDDFRTALKLNPDSIYTRRGIIQVYLSQKKTDEAAKLADEIQTIAPKETAGYLARARVLMSKKEADKARQELKRALEIDPLNVDALQGQIQLSLESKDYTAASQDVARVSEVAPKSPDGYVLRAEVNLAQQDFQRALDDVTKAIEINPKDPVAQWLAANANFLLKEYAKAKTFCEEALRLNPKNEHAQQLMAYIALEQKEYERAISEAQKALKMDGEMGSLYLLMADAHVAMGDYAAATKDLKDALAFKSKLSVDELQKIEDGIAFYTSVPPLVDGKRTVRDTKLGYTLNYSPVWDPTPSKAVEEGTVLTLNAHDNPEKVKITVSTLIIPEKYAKLFTVQLAADFFRMDLIPLGVKFTPRQQFVGFEYGLTDDISLTTKTVDLRGRLFYFYINSGRLFVIELSAPADQFDKYTAEAEKVAKTFAFIK